MILPLRRTLNLVFVVASLFATLAAAWPVSAQEPVADPVAGPSSAAAPEVYLVPAGSLLSVELNTKSWKRVHANSPMEGRLRLPVYAGQRLLIPEGTKIRFQVESVAKVREATGKWKRVGRGIERAFNPIEAKTAPEYAVSLSNAQILIESSTQPIDFEVLRAGDSILVQPKPHAAKGVQSGMPPENPNSATNKTRASMLLRLTHDITPLIPITTASASQPHALREGQARAFLLNQLSASQNRRGDRFQAILAEPVLVGGHLFEPGSVMEGSVVRSIPPRILSRSGTLYVRFEQLTSPQQSVAVTGSLQAAESATQARFVLDDEGILRGRQPGVKNAVIDLGIAYALGKGADDIAETPIRAVGAAMSDAAVANAARYFGLGASAVFLVTRHGHDVSLSKYAELDVQFGRTQD